MTKNGSNQNQSGDWIAKNEEDFIIDLLNSPAGIEILNKLVKIDPFSLSKPQRLDYLAALEKQSGWLQAKLQQAIVAVAGDEPSEAESMYSGVDEFEREEVATALRLSANTAQIKIDVARTLNSHLPIVSAALATGDISAQHATVIAKEVEQVIRQGVEVQTISEIEKQAISYAEFHTPAQVASKVRSTIAKLAPQQFEEVVEKASESRKVEIYPHSDGMSTILALLPAVDAQTVFMAIEKIARATDDKKDKELDLRTIDMKRADALTKLATIYLGSTTENNQTHRRPITLNLTMDLPTLLGLKENPGQLAGYGAIPAKVARELATDAKWRRFITDPITGNLLDYGRESYEPPQHLVDFLIARDRTCRFPGCRQPAHRADIDHAVAWEDGGKTSVQNLGVLCRRHHLLKTHGGWKLTSNADGSCNWVSPLGREYFVPARPIDEVA